MEMIDVKRKLLDLKRIHCLKETIDKSDLMILINIAWNKSFGRIDMNKKAITHRGWGSYNRNILTLSRIRATMTETEKQNDVNCEVFIVIFICKNYYKFQFLIICSRQTVDIVTLATLI